ncbi:MAG TPA: FxsA family protein [Firmicutes bacterium]|nr:FxsA family protein [Bacillota bacterium]
MLLRLALVFITVPLVELALLVQLGRYIGLGHTLGLVIITGIVGGYVAKQQGLQTIARIRREIAAGHVPTAQLWDGLFILIGGLLLITPGILTDLLGFLLLMPNIRQKVKEVVFRRIQRWIGDRWWVILH